MADNFDTYVERLLEHERAKTERELTLREQIRLHAGRGLNWLGDFVGNPKIQWELHTLAVDEVRFTGTSPEWNRLLKDECEALPQKLREKLKTDPALKSQLLSDTKQSDETPILVRRGDRDGEYKVLDGMHRFVGAVVRDQTTIQAWIPVNEQEVLPECEPHVVYDVLRGVQRHAHDAEGQRQLVANLRLLRRTYANVDQLLRDRFDATHIDDKLVQDAIAEALNG